MPKKKLTPQQKKAAAAKKLKASSDAKKKAEAAKNSWQDSTYKRQTGYYKKIAADYSAEEIRKKGDIANYYGAEDKPGVKTKVTKKKVFNKNTAFNKKRAAQAKVESKKARAAASRLKKMKKSGNKVAKKGMYKGKSIKQILKAGSTSTKLATKYKKQGKAGYNPFSKKERALYSGYKKYATAKKAADYKKKSTATYKDSKQVNVFGTKKIKTEILKDIYKKRKMSGAEKKRYSQLVKRGNPKKAGKKAVAYRKAKTRGAKIGTVKTGKYKTSTKRFQKYYMKGKRVGVEGIYQKQLRETRAKDLSDIKDDYAARGVLRSGIYAKKNSDYEQEFGRQLGELNRKKKSSYQGLATERRTFNREQSLQKEQARLEAIRRKAAKTGSFI